MQPATTAGLPEAQPEHDAMTGRREIRAALIAGLVPLGVSEILAVANLVERQFGAEPLVAESGEFFRVEALYGAIAFGMSLPIYLVVASLAARLKKPWFPYGVAVLLPLTTDQLLSALPLFSPRGDGGYFGAIWLFGPTVALVGVLLVAYVRRKATSSPNPPATQAAEQKLSTGP